MSTIQRYNKKTVLLETVIAALAVVGLSVSLIVQPTTDFLSATTFPRGENEFVIEIQNGILAGLIPGYTNPANRKQSAPTDP